MENFLDDDEEEILTDNDLIEMDENDLMYDSQASSSEELNHMDAKSEIIETEDLFEMAPEHCKLLQSFSLTDHANVSPCLKIKFFKFNNFEIKEFIVKCRKWRFGNIFA